MLQVSAGAARDVGQGAVVTPDAMGAAAFAYSTAEERRAASEPRGGALRSRRWLNVVQKSTNTEWTVPAVDKI